MKNRKRILGLMLILIAAVLMLSACSDKKKEIEGTWKYTYDLGSYYTLSFSDGNGVQTYVNTITGEKQNESFSYKIDGNKLIMKKGNEEETVEWKVTGKTLTLTSNGNTIALEKQ